MGRMMLVIINFQVPTQCSREAVREGWLAGGKQGCLREGTLSLGMADICFR
jgi:hypothetical protein